MVIIIYYPGWNYYCHQECIWFQIMVRSYINNSYEKKGKFRCELIMTEAVKILRFVEKRTGKWDFLQLNSLNSDVYFEKCKKYQLLHVFQQIWISSPSVILNSHVNSTSWAAKSLICLYVFQQTWESSHLLSLSQFISKFAFFGHKSSQEVIKGH